MRSRAARGCWGIIEWAVGGGKPPRPPALPRAIERGAIHDAVVGKPTDAVPKVMQSLAPICCWEKFARTTLTRLHWLSPAWPSCRLWTSPCTSNVIGMEQSAKQCILSGFQWAVIHGFRPRTKINHLTQKRSQHMPIGSHKKKMKNYCLLRSKWPG